MPPTNAEYAKINIACKQLGIDKYGLIADRYGLESTKQLTQQQTVDLLLHFKALGWQPVRKKSSTKKGKSSPRYEDARMRKVVALWITLAKEGVVKNSANYALQKYVKRITRKANLLWCETPDLNLLIDGLKQWGKREGVNLD